MQILEAHAAATSTQFHSGLHPDMRVQVAMQTSVGPLMAKTQRLKPELSDSATGYSHKSKWLLAFGLARLHSPNFAEPMGTPDLAEPIGTLALPNQPLRILR